MYKQYIDKLKEDEMKSFVITAAAALVAASGALANSTDASRSGTVPELPDQCYFHEVVDGAMYYFPGHYQSNIRHGKTYESYIGGRWVATRSASFRVKHRGASELIVEATNKLVNSSTGRVYDVQVDYNNPSTVNTIAPSMFWNINEMGPHIPSYSGKSVRIISGEYQFDAVSAGWFTPQYKTVESALAPHMENQAGVSWTPVTTRSDALMEAEDRVRFDLVEDVELNLADQLSRHDVVIGGIAWMVDDMGVSQYDPDNHDLEDGNYYIEHKVTCVQ